MANVSLKQIAASVADELDITTKDAKATLELAVANIVNHLKERDKVRIPGLGILSVKDRPERQGCNPGTGETITIKASRKVAFRAAKELKEAV